MTPGEKITVPLMMYILLTLLPLILVRKAKQHALAAANGQFMLFDASVYKKIWPHEKMKRTRVEDIAIARLLKQQHYSVACVTTKNEVSCRMYSNYLDAVHGFSRSFIAFFGGSFLLAYLFWVFTTFGFFFVWVVFGLKALMWYLAIVLITRIMVSIASSQSVVENILYIVPQQFAMGHILLLSTINHYKKKYLWKGRSVS